MKNSGRSHFVMIMFCLLVSLRMLLPGTSSAQVTVQEGTNTLTVALGTLSPIIGVPDLLPLDQMQARRDQVASSTDLADSIRPQVLSQWDQALAIAREVQPLEGQLQALQTVLRTGPARMDQIRSELAQLGQNPPESPAADLGTTDLEEGLNTKQVVLTVAQDAFNRWEQELRQTQAIPRTVPDLLADVEHRRQALSQELAGSALEENAPATVATRQLQAVRRARQQLQFDLYTLQANSQELLSRFQTAERDLATAQVQRLKAEVKAWETEFRNRRIDEASSARREAQRAQLAVSTLPDTIQELARENVRLNQELEKVTAEDAAVALELRAAQAKLQAQKDDMSDLEQRIAVVGRTERVGRLLVRKRAELPSRRLWRGKSSDRIERISIAANRNLDLDQEQRRPMGLDEEIDQVMASLPEGAEQESSEIRAQVQNLLQKRQQSLRDLRAVYGRLVMNLTSLELTEKDILTHSAQYAEHLDEWLLYTRTMPRLTLVGAFLGVPRTLQWIVHPGEDGWLPLLRDLHQIPPGSLAWLLAGLLAGSSCLATKRLLKRRISSIADDVKKIRTDSFLLTLRVLVDTLILAAGWPLIMLSVSLALRFHRLAGDLSLALSESFFKGAIFLLFGKFLQESSREYGLMDRHFRWPRAACRQLECDLRVLLIPGTLLVMIALASSFDEIGVHTLGDPRVPFILLMFLTAWFLYRLLHPWRAVTHPLQQRDEIAWVMHLRFLWYPFLVGLPLVLALVSILGFQSAAFMLYRRCFETVALLCGLILLRDLLIRWFTVTERRLRYRNALRRQEEWRAARLKEDQGVEPESGDVLSVDIPEVNVTDLAEQARRLIRLGILLFGIFGVWSIWVQSVPILGFLDNVELPLNTMRRIGGEAQVLPMTLADLTLGLIALLFTGVAATNVPGLLEITVLQRLPIDTGARYAITSLAQYTIVAVGIVLSFHTLGFQWSSIQWLVAALGVGLGFGLQEIVANFISGIIILFERPVKVGDIVTVGDTTGIVSRIRIRATTILNWERQELLVPNKEFITGRLLNWTLSDTTNRIVITVGIAYGSDVKLAMGLVMQVAEENDNVLKDPRPFVSFEGFGDSALTLLLRAYLPNLDNRLLTISQLNEAINQRFRENGVEIPFPQRDLHLRAGDTALRIQMDQNAGTEPRIHTDGHG